MYCIQETDKPNFILKTFNIIKLIENKIILPVNGNEILSSNKTIKLAKKTKKILDKAISKRIVVSKKIQNYKEYIELLNYYDFKIVDGKWLFEVLSCKTLDYVIRHKKMKKQEISISILVNDLSENMIEIIKQIAKEYKRVNIVTNYMEKFKKIIEQILEEDGIMVTVGNNKRKSLIKSEIILNVDFSSQMLNQYNIYEEAIIINIYKKVLISKKRFNGICINNYEIEFKSSDNYDYDKNTKYKACELYEAQINKRQPFNDIIKQIEKDKVRIIKLKGKNSNY